MHINKTKLVPTKCNHYSRQNFKLEKDGKTIISYIGKGCEKLEQKIKFQVSKPELKHEIEFRIVLWDQAQLKLTPTLRVEKGAKNTDTYLKATCLLMSEKASAEITPSLEILEDEVKSGHGATISSIDPEQIKYLMSRGVTQDQAENIIIQGFLT